MKPTLLILAAGIGSRYGGLKQVDPVGPCGEAIIDYSIYDALRAGFGKVVFVIRKNFEEAIKNSFEPKLKGRIETAFAYQELDTMVPRSFVISPERVKPWGTGHAVLVSRDVVREPFAVINADDFYGRGAYLSAATHLKQSVQGEIPEFCMIGYPVGLTLSEHGSVSRGVCATGPDGYLESVVERTNIRQSGDRIVVTEGETTFDLTPDTCVSMNIWGFTPAFFGFLENMFGEFIRSNAENPKAEFYIPSVVNHIIRNKQARLKVISASDRWFGVTYREDREIAIAHIRELISRGVYPEKLWA